MVCVPFRSDLFSIKSWIPHKKKYSKSDEEIENIRIEKLNESIRKSNDEFKKEVNNTLVELMRGNNKKTKSKTKSNSNTEDN